MYKDEYTMMYKNKVVGILAYDYVNHKFSFEFKKEYNDTPPYPLVRWGECMSNKIVVEKDIIDWLSDRVIQECRPEVKDILSKLNLYEYDIWDIARRNYGMSGDDYFWLNKDTSLDYRTFNTRYCFYNDITPTKVPPFLIMKYPKYFEIQAIKNGKEWIEEWI